MTPFGFLQTQSFIAKGGVKSDQGSGGCVAFDPQATGVRYGLTELRDYPVSEGVLKTAAIAEVGFYKR